MGPAIGKCVQLSNGSSWWQKYHDRSLIDTVPAFLSSSCVSLFVTSPGSARPYRRLLRISDYFTQRFFRSSPPAFPTMSPCGQSNCSFVGPSSIPSPALPHHGVSAEVVVAVSFGVVMFLLAVFGLWQGRRRRNRNGKTQCCTVPAHFLPMTSAMCSQTSRPRETSAPEYHGPARSATLADTRSSSHHGPRGVQPSTLA